MSSSTKKAPLAGSLGYATLLSPRDDLGGQLGAPELDESPFELKEKVDALAALIRGASSVVAFTGAGISCASPSLSPPFPLNFLFDAFRRA